MQIAVLGYGSRGDIQPALALSDALVRRGHNVRTTINVNAARWASASGLELVAIPPDVEAFLKSDSGRELLAKGKVAQAILEFSRLEHLAHELGESVSRAGTLASARRASARTGVGPRAARRERN